MNIYGDKSIFMFRSARITALIFLSSVLFSQPCFSAATAGGKLSRGNTLYNKGDFAGAQREYSEAVSARPESDILNYNLGAASYKNEDYRKAGESFTRALAVADTRLEADALYNLGNCRYKQAKAGREGDLSSSAGLLREALDYYKRAIELDQGNKDARFNYEFTQKELKDIEQDLKQQGGTSQKQNDNREQKAQGQQEQSGRGEKDREQNAGEQQQEQSSGQDEEQPQAQQADREDSADSREENSDEIQQESGEELQGQQEKQLTEDEARVLLERYGKEEAVPDFMDKSNRRGYDTGVFKDW